MKPAVKKPAPPLLDDAALKRLEELTRRKKTGPRLTGAEDLELRELQLRKAETKLVKDRAICIKNRRQLEDQAKYRLGALALAAGLEPKLPDDLLTAWFARLATLSDEQKADFLSAAAKVDSAVDVAVPSAPEPKPEPARGFGGVPLPAQAETTLGMLMNERDDG